MTSPTPLNNVDHRWTVTASLPIANPWSQILRNKVPEVTILFWIVKILSTTVGESVADFLSGGLGLGLSATTAIMSLLLAAVLIWQLATRRYIPGVYWLTVVLVSVVGTLFSNNLVDNLGVSLWTTTAIFLAALAVAFVGWYRSERTVSIHTIATRRREAWYWFAILCTFSLGTSAGELISDKLALGYEAAGLIFGGAIAVITLAHFGFKVNAAIAFWAAYIMTRPFSASIGDFLTAAPKGGGLGLGTNGISLIFLAVILAIVGWFTAQARTRHDQGQDARV
jgi:uncharacterized membrane-anchored protein